MRGSELVTFRMVPHRCLSCARARSLSPLVFESNHWSIFASEVMSWSISRASYLQVQNDLVVHRLVVLVGVDVRAEDLDAALLVGPEERGSGEADERGAGEDGLCMARWSLPDCVR